jgi:hypothetical protein
MPSGVAVDQSIPPFLVEARTRREAMRIWMLGRMQDGAGRPSPDSGMDEAPPNRPVQTISWLDEGTSPEPE